LNDWFSNKPRNDGAVDWLGLDARIDSAFYSAWNGFKERWSRTNDRVAQLKLTGLRWTIVELASEAFTLGLGGLAVMLVLAQPSFEAVAKGDWLSYGKYAVTFYDKDGTEIGTRGILRSDAVALEEMPDHFIKAVLATEDRRFFEHYGIDVFGTVRALIENMRAQEVVQGGSSITQQLAKNVFLSSERSLQRKVKEAFLALWLETHVSKQQILKLYLERAYMGGGAFGAEAAAQHYFGKSIRTVSIAEGAMLAGLFKAPTNYSPNVNLAAARERANEVLSNLVQAGYMTEGQVHGARINPATPVDTRRPDSPDWFLDWAFEEVQRLMVGKTDTVLNVRTTVDLAMQRAGDSAVQTAIRDGGAEWNVKQAALVSMSPDGAVRTIVGGVDYGESGFNRATHGKRQPGSSFKPYVYLAALEAGLTPSSSVTDKSYYCGKNHWIKNYDGGNRGRTNLITALTHSINTIAVQLSQDVGRKTVSQLMRRMGVTPQYESCTMALGDGALSLLEHTGGYAVFANGGLSANPYSVVEIANSKGDVIYTRERDAPAQRQVVERRYIEMLNEMMRSVVTSGTARAAELEYTTAAGKTGTTSSHRDAWFVGYTGQYVTGVWFGNDDNRPMTRVTGGHGPAPVWKEFMTAIYTTSDFPAIPGVPMLPSQIATLEQQRALQAADPTLDRKPQTPGELGDDTRKLLKKIAGLMRQASGVAPQASVASAPGKPTIAPTAVNAAGQPVAQPNSVKVKNRSVAASDTQVPDAQASDRGTVTETPIPPATPE
jgi:penicillin-binding protein 1A